MLWKKKISSGEQEECRNGCSAIAASYRNGIPYSVDCLLAEQEKAWNNDESINSDGEVVKFKIVRKLDAERK